jgi:hypothetical protein
MARKPTDYKKLSSELGDEISYLRREKIQLERLVIEKSNYLESAREKASKHESQTIKYLGVIEYLEKHIDLLNATIEELRKPNERT